MKDHLRRDNQTDQTDIDRAAAEHFRAKNEVTGVFADTLTRTAQALTPDHGQLEAIVADDCGGDCCSAFDAADAETTLSTVLRALRDLIRITRVAGIDLAAVKASTVPPHAPADRDAQAIVTLSEKMLTAMEVCNVPGPDGEIRITIDDVLEAWRDSLSDPESLHDGPDQA